jgi:hypothetical protein
MKRILCTFLCILLAGPALAADLPDLTLTPGVTRDLTKDQICATKWGKDVRAVTAAMRRQVMTTYNMTPKACPSGKIEIDHLISRELGGSNDRKNLWPQSYDSKPWGAHTKDKLENELHRLICLGKISVKDAQSEISTNWIKAYRKHLGQP